MTRAEALAHRRDSRSRAPSKEKESGILSSVVPCQPRQQPSPPSEFHQPHNLSRHNPSNLSPPPSLILLRRAECLTSYQPRSPSPSCRGRRTERENRGGCPRRSARTRERHSRGRDDDRLDEYQRYDDHTEYIWPGASLERAERYHRRDQAIKNVFEDEPDIHDATTVSERAE